MKTILTSILVLLFISNFASAQDTLYMYKSGTVVTQSAVADVDSVIFYKELLNLFPTLNNRTNAKSFWEIYRHGILHQATLLQKKNLIKKMWLSSHRKDAIFYENNVFYVNPVEFAKHVIDVIDKDFSHFEALKHSSHPLATEEKTSDGFNGTCGYAERIPPSILMQNTKPFKR